MSPAPLEEAVHDAHEPGDASLLRRVHGLVGLVVLGGYTCLHLVQGWTAFVAREAWVDRVSLFALANAATIVVLAGIAAHVLTGIALARLSHDDPTSAIEPEGALGLRRLQQVTGLLLLAFLAIHVAHTWPLTRHDPVLAREGYVALQQWLETPLGLAVYVAATTSLSFHLGHGLSRMAVTFGVVRSRAGLRAARYVSGALGFVLWCLVLHWVGHFANGVGVWPITGEEDPVPADIGANAKPPEVSP